MKINSKDFKKANVINCLSFFLFFLGICFVSTANIILFFQNLDIPEQAIRLRAPRVFINIFILSFIFTAVTFFLRYFTNERHIREILNFTDMVSKGDYKDRLKKRNDKVDFYGYESIKENLNKMVEELSSVETLRTDFISNVSHELKTPLTVIQNYVTLAENPNLNEQERYEYFRQIESQTFKLSSLIANILKLNKLENQKIFTDLKEINVGELVCECMLNFEQIWEEKELNIETDISDELTLFSDSELLKIVINNLISNAVKFTEKNGTVGITVYGTSNEKVVISVRDTGCGMDSKTCNHIFEKFYQGETSHNLQGNGLGLAMVKKISDILGYEINVNSEPGVGSTFTLICK